MSIPYLNVIRNNSLDLENYKHNNYNMFDKDTVTRIIDQMGLGDFSQATIRDIQALSRQLEEKTGEPVIHLEMGVPGLKPSEIALKAEQEALANGCATIYPPNGGIPRLKEAASKFVKAFVGILQEACKVLLLPSRHGIMPCLSVIPCCLYSQGFLSRLPSVMSSV